MNSALRSTLRQHINNSESVQEITINGEVYMLGKTTDGYMVTQEFEGDEIVIGIL